MTRNQFERKISDNWLLFQLRKALRATGNGKSNDLYIDMNTGKTHILSSDSHYRKKNLFCLFTVRHNLGEKAPTATSYLERSAEGYKELMRSIANEWYGENSKTN